ncbi:MAG TPA: cytochrome c [Nitrosomonas nitrosa]|jgi:mono/diheme cytochrome c family protein|uniref:Cytochrome C oxidase, cbb3-type, subunit III n=1 Tax=Nitrosomonas nitrosa TaxID=52442 RepID=A0A1I4P6R8_9PROT|nr:cytochrome c [Nitrosomonas nitrosa]MCO6434565.1 cytochrome c [Nitrosomonas nitrosa]PTQ97116.1 cytochrome c551 [Nitrosomonas nitrosa]CAE6509959.1 Cytochrome C oxidase, cbb3-type, subunit III [Nitrosomonas nitrosa]SFM23452.1 cytochrome c551 [Nitrosomonas nitrosa]HBZ30802.1 cytochrome c [Nitrosomonas nitrosa]
MRKIPLLMVCALIVLSGCSRDKYMPEASATPEIIFKEACAKCHTPVNGKVMALSPSMANTEAIIDRIRNGKGFSMPAFPNLMGDSVEGLAQYILENSETK